MNSIPPGKPIQVTQNKQGNQSRILKILIGGENSLTIHEIDVVCIVEDVRCSKILEGEGVEVFGWAYGFEILSESLVHDSVLGVETVAEGSALGNSDGVAA
uniref:Uncharacterized protein n=1 Tax=Cannabis sativa TaxID=3483 RepID=A0A803Q8G8_CANSA